ncbi:MAG: hypothetical protein LBC27_08190 [Spirochaetaceae bacterium]|nr:hypothetical protein [Spirochaetaceae bacterium]
MNKKKKKEKLLGLIPLISLLVLAVSCGSAEDALSLGGEQKKDTTSQNGVLAMFNGGPGNFTSVKLAFVGLGTPVVDPIVEFTDPDMTMETWLISHGLPPNYNFIEDSSQFGPKWQPNNEGTPGGGGTVIRKVILRVIPRMKKPARNTQLQAFL